jgi:hypothetical protein
VRGSEGGRSGRCDEVEGWTSSYVIPKVGTQPCALDVWLIGSYQQ